MVTSESRFIWKQLLFLIKLPILLLLVVFRKRRADALTTPCKEFYEFVREARITYYLILINIFIFILSVIIISINPNWILPFIFQPQDLIGLNIQSIVGSWFLHANLAHLIGNMLFLFIFGRVVEEEFKSGMLGIYFFSAFVATFISSMAGLGGIGASGAIAGLVAAAILLRPLRTTYLIGGIPLPLFVIGWGAMLVDITNVLIPQPTVINHFAHMGGYLAITIAVFFIAKEQRKKMKKGLLLNLLFLAIYAFFAWPFI